MTKIHKLTELNENIKSEYDLYLCMASFEMRCLAIPQHIDVVKLHNIVIFFMGDFLNHIAYNKTMLEKKFVGKANCVELKHSNPIFTADKIIESLESISQSKNIKSIMIDITTFTHESLLMLIKILKIVFPVADITFAYVNATEYDSRNKKNDKWLSKGIGEIRSVLGYPGDILPIQKTHLIVVVGYEYERATSIINSLEPNLLTLGFGRSDNATTAKDKDANEHYLQLVEEMAFSYQALERFEIKCNDPLETCKKIEYQVSMHNDMNVVIVPLNNKLSTLGVALAAMKNENIQLCYAPALTYNYFDYSKTGENCYIINDII